MLSDLGTVTWLSCSFGNCFNPKCLILKFCYIMLTNTNCLGVCVCWLLWGIVQAVLSILVLCIWCTYIFHILLAVFFCSNFLGNLFIFVGISVFHCHLTLNIKCFATVKCMVLCNWVCSNYIVCLPTHNSPHASKEDKP